jgi:hypothetical protein
MKENNSMAADLVARRGNRCTASTLGWLESNVKPHLSDDLWHRTRRTVLDNINEFKDLAIDVVKSDASMINQEYVEHLEEIKRGLRDLRAYSRGTS